MRIARHRILLSASLLTAIAIVAAMLAQAQPAAAQSDGDAICAEALVAADEGASRYGRYEITVGSGGGGSQVVLGTDGGDTIDGGSGNDILCGFGGDDGLIGGSGNDILVGGPGVDQLFGDSGGDTLYGDSSDFVLFGGTGSNQVIVAEPPPAVLTYALTPVDGGCSISTSLTGGPASTFVDFEFDLANDPGTGVSTGAITDASGAVDIFGVYIMAVGATVTAASVSTNATGVVIATAPGGQVCGG